MAPARTPVDVTPSARRLTGSLRDIGYDFVAALADIVDNSVAAGASAIDVEIVFDGAFSFVMIADDGSGMTGSEVNESLRFGTRRDYDIGELGKYGLGLKTASISQCRRVTVVSRRAVMNRRFAAKTLDIDHIEKTDRWEVIDPPQGPRMKRCVERLDDGPGTVVLWENLDRVLTLKHPEGGWAKRRLEQLADRSRRYLGMVFHRYLDGETSRGGPRLTIAVNGEKASPWNPFAPLEEHRVVLPPLSFEVAVGDLYGRVTLNRFILPPRGRFSSLGEFERLGGPQKWNRQQGLYIYRADRLIQHGGWCGIRAVDEHTKLGRASLDFQTDLDPLFRINVAKMRASLPPEVRTLLERPIHELCHRADGVYRRESMQNDRKDAGQSDLGHPRRRNDLAGIGGTLTAAALDAGEHRALTRIMERLRMLDSELAESLGW